jgi:hypothetical protein
MTEQDGAEGAPELADDPLTGLGRLIKRILVESSFVPYDPGRPPESGSAFALSPFSEELVRGVLVTVVWPAAGVSECILLLDRMHDVLAHEGLAVAETAVVFPPSDPPPPGATFAGAPLCLRVYYLEEA